MSTYGQQYYTMKVDTKGKLENPEGRVNKWAVFTGEALLNVEAINPSREDIIKIRGFESIADKIEEPIYKDVILKGTPFTKIDVLLSFEPNKILGVDNEYPEKQFVNYPIFINSELSLNKIGTKAQVIDDHNQSGWIPYDPASSAAGGLKKGLDEGMDYLKEIDSTTVRYAKVGEVLLYSFIFNMTTLPRHNPERNSILGKFVLGNDPKKATEAFDAIVNGDFKPLQDIVNSDICQYTDGKVAKVGGMLGVRINNSNPDSVRFYEEIMSHPTELCTFRESYTSGTMRGIHLTRLSSGAYDRLVDPNYGWNHEWNGSMKFQEYDTHKYTPLITVENGQEAKATAKNLPF